MFDFDAGKLLILGVVALIVIGPKELPGVMRQVGQAVAKLRRMAAEFQSQFMEAMREAELDDLKKELASVQEAAKIDVDFNPVEEVKREMTAAVTPPTTPAENEVKLVEPPPEVPLIPVHSSSDAQSKASQQPPVPSTSGPVPRSPQPLGTAPRDSLPEARQAERSPTPVADAQPGGSGIVPSGGTIAPPSVDPSGGSSVGPSVGLSVGGPSVVPSDWPSAHAPNSAGQPNPAKRGRKRAGEDQRGTGKDRAAKDPSAQATVASDTSAPPVKRGRPPKKSLPAADSSDSAAPASAPTPQRRKSGAP